MPFNSDTIDDYIFSKASLMELNSLASEGHTDINSNEVKNSNFFIKAHSENELVPTETALNNLSKEGLLLMANIAAVSKIKHVNIVVGTKFGKNVIEVAKIFAKSEIPEVIIFCDKLYYEALKGVFVGLNKFRVHCNKNDKELSESLEADGSVLDVPVSSSQAQPAVTSQADVVPVDASSNQQADGGWLWAIMQDSATAVGHEAGGYALDIGIKFVMSLLGASAAILE